LRPVDRAHRFVMKSLREPHRCTLDRSAAGLARNVAYGRGGGDQQRLPGDPGHLQKRVDRAVEGQSAVEEALGGGARYDLPDRSERRCVGPQQGESAAARDRRPLSERLGRQQHIIPCRPLGGRELEERREFGRIDFSVIFEYEGEVEILVDDPPPGRAMAQENADLRRRQSERIARSETATRISLVELLPTETRSIDRGDDLALDRQARAQRLDVRRARNRPLQVENKGFGGAQDWLSMQRPAIMTAGGARAPSYAPLRAESCRLPAPNVNHHSAAPSPMAPGGLSLVPAPGRPRGPFCQTLREGSARGSTLRKGC